jgi:hypothetical protein
LGDSWKLGCEVDSFTASLFYNRISGVSKWCSPSDLPTLPQFLRIGQVTYSGPTERLGGVSLDTDQRGITITIPDQSEKFTLEVAEDETATAVHANEKQFRPDELAEEVIRSITQIEAGRKFKRPKRKIKFDDDETRTLREL